MNKKNEVLHKFNLFQRQFIQLRNTNVNPNGGKITFHSIK